MIRKMLLYVLSGAAGIALALALSAVFTVENMTGSGMEPVLSDGDHILVNRMAYGKSHDTAPAVGDIVAFRCDVHGEDGEGAILVRRVAGSSGDVIEIKDNIFYLNGSPDEEYMSEPADMQTVKKTTLGKNEIFVLSDDRRASMDSRNEAVGIVDSRECIGKVCFR